MKIECGSVSVAYSGWGPIFLRSHPILAVGPQNVGMNQKGIGPRRPLHDSQRNTGEGEREGVAWAGGRENMATINWSSER